MAFGGTYVTTDPPQRSGLFANVEAVATPVVRDIVTGIVGLVVQADWGPDNSLVSIESQSEAKTVYHTGQTAYFAISNALLGEGINGRYGASAVLAYRITGSARAKATRTLQNTTPATALTLTAKYNGVRANNFTVTVQTNAADGTKKDLILLEGTTVLETFTNLATDVTGMATLINASSNYMTAAMNITGVALANVSASAFAGGNSGTTTVIGDHDTAKGVFESNGLFDVFAVDNLPDDTNSIRTAYRDWIARINGEGKLCHFVTGGLAAETVATATARATNLGGSSFGNPECFVTTYGDVTLTFEGTTTTYSSSQMAPRMAGIIAGAGVVRSITGAAIPGSSMATPPTSAQIEALVRGQVVPYYSDGGTIKIQRGRTCWIASTANSDVRFKSLLFVRRLHYTFRRFDFITSTKIIGQNLSNTASGRDAILNFFKAELRSLETQNLTIPNGSIYYDPGQDQTGETLFMIFSYRPAPGIEQILARVQIPT